MNLFLRSSIITLLSLLVLVATDKLDDVLTSSSGIFPSNSVKCGEKPSNTAFSSVFRSTNDVSNWRDVNIAYEPNAFEIDMIHNDDANPERSWSLRLGKGGQIMSLIVKPGESMANQGHHTAIWNDLVQQMVSVNGELNGVGGKNNFIHGAGVYANETEGTKPPFYSPKLALKCEGNDCTMINWGQQAHVPTPWDSPLLYYTRYHDCGDGIIQYDMAIYHFGQNASRFDYFNTPWTAVRTSIFPDLMTSDNKGKLQIAFPLQHFGAIQLLNLDQTGGFSTFAEKVGIPADYSPPFCVDKNNQTEWHDCNDKNVPENSSVPFSFDVKVANSSSHTDHWKNYGLAADSTVRMRWCDLSTTMPSGSWGWGSPAKKVVITNDDTGFSFESDYIIHYCWIGVWTYMSASVNATVINEQFPVGASISVAYRDKSGLPWNEQNALTFVHGKGSEYRQDWHRAKSRIRYGTTGPLRDGTVFTTNFIGTLNNGEVYFSRKFLVSDLLSNMETVGPELSDDAYEEVYTAGNYGDGEIINLWTSDILFGATVGTEECRDATFVCKGNSAPSENLIPLFYITCGTNKIITHDPYTDPYLGTAINEEFKRPYKCQLDPNDLTRSGRANWKLLGFFPDGTCSSIGSLEYLSDLCESAPSSVPTEVQSLLPSLTNSMIPSALPNFSPSSVESSEPSLNTSSVSTNVPTFFPSLTPSCLTDSASPSSALSSEPSSNSSSILTNVPTFFPSLNPSCLTNSIIPSQLPNASPSSALSSEPSSNSSSMLTNAPTFFPSLIPSGTPSKFNSFDTDPTTSPVGISSGVLGSSRLSVNLPVLVTLLASSFTLVVARDFV